VTALDLPLADSVAGRLIGRPLLLLLDVDGTLAPIAERPEYAAVPPATQRVLSDLTSLPETHVAIVSGRGARDARRLVGVKDVWVIGNHGIEVARPNAPPSVRRDIAQYAERIAVAAERCLTIAEGAPGVIVEDKRWTLSVHYRLAARNIIPALSAHVAAIAEDLDLRVTVGKEVLEVRPPVDVNKGTACVALAHMIGALESGASIFCAGDDSTDEDAFRALRDEQPLAVTVRVGADSPRPETSAEFTVADTSEVHALLETILELRRAQAIKS
jgi:trehalose 6-phosphate phosphatase